MTGRIEPAMDDHPPMRHPVHALAAANAAWIAHVESMGNDAMPAPGCVDDLRRDAFTRFAVIRGLFAPRFGEGLSRAPDVTFGTLVGRILAASRDERTTAVLRPVPQAGARASASSHEAQVADFFNERLAPVLARVAQAYGGVFADLAAHPCDARDDASIARWSRAWTTCVALVALDWIAGKATSLEKPPADTSAMRLALSLWSGPTARFRVQRGSPLPIGDETLPLELDLELLVAQVLADDPAHWRERERRAAVPVRMHALQDGTRGTSVVQHRRDIADVYLMVLAQALHDAAATAAGVAVGSASVEASERRPDADQGFVDRAASVQRSIRLVPSTAAPAGPFANDAAESDWAPLDHVSIGFVPAPVHAAADALQALGSVELWPSLHRTPLWLDFTCLLVQVDGVVEPLAIVLDDVDSSAPPSDVRSALVLDTSSSPTDPARLADAIADPSRATWRYRFTGLGVLVALRVDLGPRAP